jgi:hypothetical protein
MLEARSFSQVFRGSYDFNLTLLGALTMVRGLNSKTWRGQR